MTSHDVVGRIRRLTRQKRLGHTGTLDPAASGVLPVAIGRATRTVSSRTWDTKLYWADVAFGSATDTDDAEGVVILTGSTDHLQLDDIERVLARFVGPIDQRPPAYSAVHVGGQRGYQAARKGLVTEMPLRRVRVDAIEVAVWRPPLLSLRIQCGSGTYIRSIARDLGEAMDSRAHMASLVRLRVGPFGIADAIDLGQFDELVARAEWQAALWPVDVAALDAPGIVASPSRSLDFVYGRRWQSRWSDVAGPTDVSGSGDSNRPERNSSAGFFASRVYAPSGELLGFAHKIEGDLWQPVLGLVSGADPSRDDED